MNLFFAVHVDNVIRFSFFNFAASIVSRYYLWVHKKFLLIVIWALFHTLRVVYFLHTTLYSESKRVRSNVFDILVDFRLLSLDRRMNRHTILCHFKSFIKHILSLWRFDKNSKLGRRLLWLSYLLNYGRLLHYF